MRFVVITALVFILASTSGATAQEKESAKKDEIAELRKEIDLLRSQLDSLRSKSASATSSQSDEIDRLEERIEKRLQELENKIDAMSRATAPIVLNPRTTAFINFALRADNKDVLDASGEHHIDNRAFLRTEIGRAHV